MTEVLNRHTDCLLDRIIDWLVHRVINLLLGGLFDKLPDWLSCLTHIAWWTEL